MVTRQTRNVGNGNPKYRSTIITAAVSALPTAKCAVATRSERPSDIPKDGHESRNWPPVERSQAQMHDLVRLQFFEHHPFSLVPGSGPYCKLYERENIVTRAGGIGQMPPYGKQVSAE